MELEKSKDVYPIPAIGQLAIVLYYPPIMEPDMDTVASARPTCGTLYRLFEEQCPFLAFLHPAAIPHGDVRLADRALGHMRGQAEKVYLGACCAFMIRPASDWFAWAQAAMTYTCEHYGLVLHIARDEGELWGRTADSIAKHAMDALEKEPKNTETWHALRAELCGIPREQLDTEYHQRAGWGTRCEPLNWQI